VPQGASAASAVRSAGEPRLPGHKATPEALSVERGDDVAQMFVGSASRREGARVSQQAKLRLAKTRNVGEVRRARQNRQKRQKSSGKAGLPMAGRLDADPD
jgi:hypothetical protein